MLCGEAGAFQMLEFGNARHGAAAGAAVAVASARAVSVASARTHAVVRTKRTLVSLETRNIQSGSAAPVDPGRRSAESGLIAIRSDANTALSRYLGISHLNFHL